MRKAHSQERSVVTDRHEVGPYLADFRPSSVSIAKLSRASASSQRNPPIGWMHQQNWWSNTGQALSKLPPIGQIRGNLGPSRADCLVNIAKLWPEVAKFGVMSTRSGKTWERVARYGPSLGRCRPILARPKSNKTHPESSRSGSSGTVVSEPGIHMPIAH